MSTSTIEMQLIKSHGFQKILWRFYAEGRYAVLYVKFFRTPHLAKTEKNRTFHFIEKRLRKLVNCQFFPRV